MATLVATQYVPVRDIHPRPALWAMWERRRNRRQLFWLVDCIAEAMGTFLYTWAGAGSSAAFVLGNILEIGGLGSVFQIGFAYAIGIVMAIIVCQATTEGTFNIGITVHAVVFKGFPIGRAARQIISQIIGAYIACLLIYVQYKQSIDAAIATLKAKGLYESVMFTPSGPGGIFGLYAPPGANLGYVVVNEFVCDFVIAVVIFASHVPSSHFCTPAVSPWLIALTYAVVIWSYAPNGLSANASRDLGGRIAAWTLFGKEASGGNYAAIAALVNIPATLAAGVFFEMVLNDSTRSVNPQWAQEMGALAADRARKANVDEEASSLRSVNQLDDKFDDKIGEP